MIKEIRTRSGGRHDQGDRFGPSAWAKVELRPYGSIRRRVLVFSERKNWALQLYELTPYAESIA